MATDKEIVSLPESGAVTDDTLFVVYQPGAAEPAQKLTAEQLGEYAVKKVDIPDVTAESIQEALGYTPANEENVAQINENLVGKKGTAEGAEIFNDYADNKAEGTYSHVEGYKCSTSGYRGAHAEGHSTSATGDHGSHAEGQQTIASGKYGSHAEGMNTTASGEYGSHAEGMNTTASGETGAHAEGHATSAKGDYGCHAEGSMTTASGSYGCHVEGCGTHAYGESQHVQGRWNFSGGSNYAHIVGNGEDSYNRSNAHTLDWEGNAWFAGDVYVGSTSGTNMDEGSKKLATVAEVGEMIGQMPGGDVTAESIKTALGYTPADAEDVRQLSEEIGDEFNVINSNIRAVAHRGLSLEAPENTLSAYRMAREKGFTYVECDVAVTADGVPVLLHDDTIDRTSNGTGSITALTFEQVRALDFGSWFSADFAGEKIPTLEEFVIFCKWNGLHPYIEIKENVSADKIPTIVGVVRRYDMLRNVSWISFSSALLEAVKTQDAKARLGYVVGGASSAHITWAKSVKTEGNEVFIDLGYTQVTKEFADECAADGIPLEVWTIDSADAMKLLDPYVSGFTSDNVRANVALFGAEIPESEAPNNTAVIINAGSNPGILYVGGYSNRLMVLSTVGEVPYTCSNASYNNK